MKLSELMKNLQALESDEEDLDVYILSGEIIIEVQEAIVETNMFNRKNMLIRGITPC